MEEESKFSNFRWNLQVLWPEEPTKNSNEIPSGLFVAFFSRICFVWGKILEREREGEEGIMNI